MDFQIYKSINYYKSIVSEDNTKLWLRWGSEVMAEFFTVFSHIE